MSQPEQPDLRLGFIALNDCAPLVIAQEQGFFREEGLNIHLSREASWANIRDKMAVGALDGAHMLGPMAIACTLGLSVPPIPMIVPYSLSLNGAAITVSAELAMALRAADPDGMTQRPRTARPLKRLIDQRRRDGLPSLVFAVVYPFSAHNYELRYWLAEAGVDPDRDVRLVVAPPPRMSELLRNGTVDGFCVGEPWNSLAVTEGTGEILISSVEIWSAKPDKVFGVTKAWAEANPNGLQALLRALLKAGAWLAQPDNRQTAAEILSRPEFVDAPVEVVRQSILGTPPYAQGLASSGADYFTIFFRHAATFPWVSQGAWFLTQMLRWGQVPEAVSIAGVSSSIYRPDLYRQAAASLGMSAPLDDSKVEGAHSGRWQTAASQGPIDMGPDAFFDGLIFDPAKPLDYLSAFPTSRIRPSLAALAKASQTS